MLVFALLIGIISEVIGEKVDHLKEGKARVLEANHTVILGWSDKALAIIQETAYANKSELGGKIVILADHPKDEMEELLNAAIEVREHGLKLLGSQVIFRCGDPLMEKTLRQVSASSARSIIALSPDGLDPDEADSRMIRQVLALKALQNLQCHVVVEMQDIDNKHLVSLVEPNISEVVVAHDVIGRLMIQCSRSPGLANVIEELIGFQGSEFYFSEWPELAGKTFFEVTRRFDDAIPAGVKTASGNILVNPKNEYLLKAGDKLLFLAEDNNSYTLNDRSFPKYKKKSCNGPKSVPQVEKLLFCGWRRDMADMIKQLDDYVHKGSELWLLNVVPTSERKVLFLDKGNKDDLTTNNLTIKHVVGNPIVRRDLLKLEASDDSGLTGEVAYLDGFDSLLILADVENGADMQSSDSRSLSSLLLIQDVQQKLHKQHRKQKKTVKQLSPPISEILDTRTRSLLSVANCTSYVMSNQIISSLIAQVAEERDLNYVLSQLLCAEGSEIYLRQISHYLNLKTESHESFWNIALRARDMRQVALGYKLGDADGEKVILNPPNKAEKRTWKHGDTIIVIALE
jgi:Trk K+ transport system NAD-binding subunit